ncbi:MAG: DUF4390 domain-containing protein [Propionivibrio sp.]
MRCCRRIEAILLCLAMICAVFSAHAADITANSAQLTASDDGYDLSANFTVTLNPRLEDAVNKGVVLYFAADFELTRSRWYWFDEKVVRLSKLFQLSYHALTRQYRLSSGALHQSFASLDEALRVLARMRHWQVIEKGEIRADETYQAGVRLRLDPSQMPKTFQVSALSNRDWTQSSEWLLWNFSPSGAVSPGAGGDQ